MATYFKDQGKRGENAELQEELASSDKTKKRDAVRALLSEEGSQGSTAGRP